MSRPRKTRLQLMSLECKINPSIMNYTPATDYFSGNSGEVNLYVTFTGTNSISWTTNPSTTPALWAAGSDNLNTGNLRINLTGFIPAAGNLVNIDMAGQTLTGNVSITTSNLNDLVYIYNGTILGNVNINTGNNDDYVILGSGLIGNGPVTVGGALRINEGAGNDAIAFTSFLSVGGSTTINMGAGNNGYKVATPFKLNGDLTMQGGSGNDPIGQLGAPTSTIAGKARFNLGAGNNSLVLPQGLSIFGKMNYTGSSGTDNVFDNAFINGSVSVLLGGNNDTFTFGGSHFVGGAINVNGQNHIIASPGDIYSGPTGGAYLGVINFNP